MSLTRPLAPPPLSEPLAPVPPPPPKFYRRRTFLIPALLFTVAALGFAGVRRVRHPAAKPSRTVTVTRGVVDTKITETGVIEPLKKVEVKSKVGGRITHLYVQEGSVAHAGQLLAEIEPTEINSQVEQIRAQLAGTQARYERAERSVPYQEDQTRSSIRQAEESLRSARVRLQSALEEYRVQPRMTENAVRQAQAELESARSSLALLKNSTHPQETVQARSTVDDTQAQVNSLRRALDRQKRLLAKGYVSQQDVDDSTASLAAADARLDQAKQRLNVLKEQQRIDLTDADSRVNRARAALDTARAGRSQITLKRQAVDSARAEVARTQALLAAARSGVQQDRMREDDVIEARAAVTQLQNQLREVEVRQKDTHILAQQGGIVTKRYIEEGELVSSAVNSFSNGAPILQIADLSQMLVKMSVNEVDVHKVRAGLPVEIRIDGAKGVVFGGRVSKVSPAAISDANAANGGQGNNGQGGVVRFAVEVKVDRPDSRLKPGMTAKCSLIVARKKDVLRLPLYSVKGTGSTATVPVVLSPAQKGAPEKTVKRKVTLGLRGDAFVEVLSGLKPGEKIKPAAFSGPPRKTIDLDF